ncbi:hypothetical protein GOODEAATRI_001931 [Goodea atripinnis]|uniref:RNase H type-1 domain-containing protein n=1 Tax=Goodea atripinnis TaxID=208336 RepID=A0ABV0N748_9TELE
MVTTRKPLGMLIGSSFHDFELTIPVIGDLQLFVSSRQYTPDILFIMSNSRIATWMMALQGYNVEVRYGQNNKMVLGQGLAECHHCECDTVATTIDTPATPQFSSSSHHYFDENVCEELPRAYIDVCAFLHEGRPQAGVGIIWVGHPTTEPDHYQLGPKTRQYAEIATVLITLQQATALDIKQLVICSNSNYAHHSFISHLLVWKENGMRNARNKEVKHSELFLACDNLTMQQGMVVYWKKVKGHSRTLGPDKDGNDARLGAEIGTPWGFQKEWLPPSQTHAICAVTRQQMRERCEHPQSSGETLHLRSKPNDTDLATSRTKTLTSTPSES